VNFFSLEKPEINMELDNTKVVAIIGDTDSGKTNLAFHLLREYKGTRQIYLLGYPKQVDNFITLSDFNDIFLLTDSIIFMDEIHRFIKLYDKKANQALLELISLLGHNNNTLIMTTQLSQFITKSVEAFIDGWFLTRIKDIKTLKNGSKPKRIVQNTVYHNCNQWSLALKPGEYLENCDTNPVGVNGIKTFSFQNIGKDWRYGGNADNLSDKNTDKLSDKNTDKLSDKKNLKMPTKNLQEINATVQTNG